ncbi:Carbohydrate metabolism regulator TYE7 [Spathaspora sp. JA1]|nr:Carbohydrate metabolism regulator TYE7 [Spathaspora sp. JA1]
MDYDNTSQMNYQTNYNLGYMNQECYSIPLSPVDNNTETNEWMDDFLVNSAPMTTTNSGTGLHNTPLPSSTLGSQPINFAQYFEDGSAFNAGLNISNQTSYANTPENISIATNNDRVNKKITLIPTSFSEANLNHKQSLNLERLEVLFNTKDILKQEPTDSTVLKRKKTVEPSSTPVSSNESSPRISKATSFSLSPATSVESNTINETGATTIKKESKSKLTPKRRAPRKKLTDDQKRAHNKIEKRYRININAKIAGIQKIIPGVAFEKIAFETGEQSSESDNNCARLNKSMILEKATDYILYMQQRENQLQEENKKLKEQVISLGGII